MKTRIHVTNVNPHEQYQGLKFIMLKRYGSHAKPPILLIHGGVGSYKDNQERFERKRRVGLEESERNPTLAVSYHARRAESI